MNDREYEALDGIRRSSLWVIKQSPMHFQYKLLHPEEDTKALALGRAVHKYVLERDSFFEDFALIPNVDRRTKSGKELFEQFKYESDGKQWISADDMEICLDMRAALLRDKDINEILQNARETEVPFTWTDPETQIRCKCKADIITEINGMPYVIDYKTTTSCADYQFERSCRKYGYDFQAGMYIEGIEANTLEEHGFAFIAQEKTAPYAARIYWCDPSFIEAGKKIFHELLGIYSNCMKTGEWPGYESTELYGEEYV